MSQTKKPAKTEATEPKNAEGIDEQETAPEGEALNPEELAEVAGGQARHHHHPHHAHHGHHGHHTAAHHGHPTHHGHHAHHTTAHHGHPTHHGHHHHNVRHAVPVIPGIKK